MALFELPSKRQNWNIFSLLDYVGGVFHCLVQHSNDSITLDFADTPGI